MKFLQTLVSSTGFRDPAHNPDRLEVFDRLLAVVTEHDADLVVLPGGYLTVPAVQDVPGAIAELSRRADRAGIAVIGGVDVATPSADDPKTAARDAKRAATAALPYFGFASGRAAFGADPGRRWQQSSSTSANAWDVPDPDVPGPDRVVVLGTTRIGVLICGELFSSRGRESMAGLGLSLVVDLGHVGMGTGVTPAMENIARNGGCAVAHAQHVGWGGSHHFVAADGVRDSVPTDELRCVGDDEFWVAWYARTI